MAIAVGGRPEDNAKIVAGRLMSLSSRRTAEPSGDHHAAPDVAAITAAKGATLAENR
jgi:hypothetical protein